MSDTIWKYVLREVVARVEMPAGATVLTVADQDDQITLWAKVDPRAPQQTRAFHIVGTGNVVPEQADRFLGTAVLAGGRWVFHVFTDKGDAA